MVQKDKEMVKKNHLKKASVFKLKTNKQNKAKIPED